MMIHDLPGRRASTNIGELNAKWMQCNIPLYLICPGPSVGLVDRAMALAGPDLWPMRDILTRRLA